jgi:polyhydroxybutyrate depolymerase
MSHVPFAGLARIKSTALVALTILGLNSMLSFPAAAADFRITFEQNEKLRSATIYEPRRLKRVPRATIIVLHGTENGSRIRRRLGLDPLVAATGYATVYPDALNGQWNNGLEATGSLPDDVGYLRTLIGKLASYGITDPRRVYVVGASEGGMMALRFACEAGDLVAGTVTILSTLPASAANCKLTKPIPYLAVNGTADTLVPYGGGAVALKNRKGDVLSTNQTLDIFAKAASCAGERAVKQIDDKDKTDSTSAFLETYPACKVPVELIRIEGGGHAIPGRHANIGPTGTIGPVNRDIEASKVIWDFIRRLPH